MGAKKKTFDINKLGRKTKSVHQSQEIWRNKNWQETLHLQGNKIEKLLEKISFFDKWQNALQNDRVCRMFIPEIYIDAWTSIHLVSFGLYKYANMLLRSELENALRLVYFYTHPVELSWWVNQNEWYRQSSSGDIWGKGLNYFSQLEGIKKLDESCGRDRSLFKGTDSINLTLKKLSRFIHSGSGYFQTVPMSISPKYDKGKFEKWHDNFSIVQENIHVLLLTQFYEKLPQDVRKELLKNTVGNYYSSKFRQF